MGWVVKAKPRPLYPRYPLYGRLGGPPGPVWTPPGFDPRTAQPVASRYTDWVIPAHIYIYIYIYIYMGRDSVLSGRGLCEELITRPEESYWLWCIVMCDLENSWIRRLWPNGDCRAKNNSSWPQQLYLFSLTQHRFIVIQHTLHQHFKLYPGSQFTITIQRRNFIKEYATWDHAASNKLHKITQEF